MSSEMYGALDKRASTARLDNLSRVYLTRHSETLAHSTMERNHKNTWLEKCPGARPCFHSLPNPQFSTHLWSSLVSILHHSPICQYFIGTFQIFLNFQATGNFEQIRALAKTMAHTFIETFEHDISGKTTFLSQIESITKLFEKSK